MYIGEFFFMRVIGRMDHVLEDACADETADDGSEDVDGEESTSWSGDGNVPPTCKVGDQSRSKVTCRIKACLRQRGDDADEHGHRQADGCG